MLLKALFMGCLSCSLNSCSIQPQNCSSGWKITGFYTPVESDFSSPTKSEVIIAGTGKVLLDSQFVKKVRVEGWGRTQQNWYLGYYSGKWHKSEQPLNSLGLPLSIGDVAVDINIIQKGSLIVIPSIQGQFKNIEFKAVDVGSAIVNRHVDIYTGEGKQAKHETWKITGNHQVCIKSSN